MDESARRAHLNLVDSSRQLFELDPGVAVEAENGWLFGAGRSSNPAISNAAFRTDDALDPGEFLEAAQAFFGERGRGFCVWVRGDEPEDRDLAEAAVGAGLQQVFEMPQMLLDRRAEERPLPDGVEVRRLASASDAEDYWRVARVSYADLGFPGEVFDYYEDHSGLVTDNAAAFLAELDGEAVAIAMTIVSRGVAGIFWVGTLESARGRGLGWQMTAAATNAGFDLGADVASLQASVMGRPIYEAMGYEAVFDYRLLMAQPPEAGS